MHLVYVPGVPVLVRLPVPGGVVAAPVLHPVALLHGGPQPGQLRLLHLVLPPGGGRLQVQVRG